ncbi:MAG: hypothetical protein HY903_17275 [Deltaproteobacteria bacterium]|nr:hypothetical protein [Deltaproteobacteria bacterium]
MYAIAVVALLAAGCGDNRLDGAAGDDGDGHRGGGDPWRPSGDPSAPAGDDGRAHDDNPPPVIYDPVVFVHGSGGSADNFAIMIDRLVASGWPRDRLFASTFESPKWGCNVDNAATIAAEVGNVLAATGARRVDIVAHSMGSVSSRYYMKNLGGAAKVGTYVTMGGMHHGLASPCLSPSGFVCTWDELCETGDFIAALNQPPVTPGPALWVSMYGGADSTVPNESSQLDGAENVLFPGVEHASPNGLLDTEAVEVEIERVLMYPAW